MKINRDRVKRVFDEYVSNYNAEDEKISLKIHHTYRVSELCESIAKSLKLSDEDIDIAFLLGMLHDIGRFEQEKQYGTFDDSKSVNHAEFGVKLLFDEGKIRDFIDETENDDLIRDAISYHNRLSIPEGVSKRTELLSNILRDADKIDILKVHVIVPIEKIYNTSLEEFYNSTVTKEVLDSFYREETVPRNLKKTAIDTIVCHIALVFGLNFTESFNIVKQQGYLEKLLDFKSNNKETQKQFKDMRKFINKFLDKKCSSI